MVDYDKIQRRIIAALYYFLFLSILVNTEMGVRFINRHALLIWVCFPIFIFLRDIMDWVKKEYKYIETHHKVETENFPHGKKLHDERG